MKRTSKIHEQITHIKTRKLKGKFICLKDEIINYLMLKEERANHTQLMFKIDEKKIIIIGHKIYGHACHSGLFYDIYPQLN